MKNKDKKNDKFKMEASYTGSLVECRQQEMESILPGFMTVCNGKTIYSRQLVISSVSKKQK